MNWPARVLIATLPLLAAPPQKPAELFQTDKVWTVHLQFSAAQWAAITA